MNPANVQEQDKLDVNRSIEVKKYILDIVNVNKDKLHSGLEKEIIDAVIRYIKDSGDYNLAESEQFKKQKVVEFYKDLQNELKSKNTILFFGVNKLLKGLELPLEPEILPEPTLEQMAGTDLPEPTIEQLTEVTQSSKQNIADILESGKSILPETKIEELTNDQIIQIYEAIQYLGHDDINDIKALINNKDRVKQLLKETGINIDLNWQNYLDIVAKRAKIKSAA